MRRLSRTSVFGVTILACISGFAQTWTMLSANGGPTTVDGSSAVYDHASNRLIVFGGVTGTPTCCTSFNNVWILTNANGLGGASSWIQITPSTPSGAPPTRSFQSAIYDSANNRMVIFGGGVLGTCGYFCTLYNDVWVLTNANGFGGTPTWIPLLASGSAPAPREGHSAIYDAVHNRMVIFGGANNGIMNVPNDLWALDNANGLGGTPQWVQLSESGQVPPPVEKFAKAYDPINNTMTIFGGCCYWNNNTWLLTNANGITGTPTWTQLSPAGTPPAIREVHAYGYDPALNELIIFGFGAAGISYNDTWTLSSANNIGGAPTWTNIIPNSAPGSPPFPLLAQEPGVYDPFNARLMLEHEQTNAQGVTFVAPWVLALNGTSPGAISVTTNLPAASFTITGPINLSGSGQGPVIFSNLPAGTYTITFGSVVGYVTPSQQTQTLASGGTINFTGNYSPVPPPSNPNVSIALISHSNGVYNYSFTVSGCVGACIAVMNGQTAILSGMSGVNSATVLSTSGLNTCFTGSATGSAATFTETLDPVGCTFGNITLQAFQIASSSQSTGTIQYTIQTSVGPFTGTTQGPVAQSGSITLLDAIPALLDPSTQDITTRTSVLANGTPVTGIAADGVAELVLKIPTSSNDCMRITLFNDLNGISSSINEDGGLRVIGSNPSSLSNSIASLCANGNNFLYAIYRAPLDFARLTQDDSNSSQRFVSILAQSLNTGNLLNQQIKIVRPPLILIHGIWDNSSAWNFFGTTPSAQLKSDPRFSVLLLDYGPTAGTGSFKQNAGITLYQLRAYVAGSFRPSMGVAAVQVDIVAHSMGGNIVREYVITPNYFNLGNLGKGDVHKLITIDTPHNGSPLANVLLNSNPLCKLLFSSNGHPIGLALADLTVGSSALSSLQQRAKLGLQAHVLVGTANGAQEFSETTLLFPPVRGLLTNACPELQPLFQSANGFDLFFGEQNDLIVPASSQAALNLGFNGGSPPHTLFNGMIHTTDKWLFPFGPDVLSRNINFVQGFGTTVFSPTPNPAKVVQLLNTPVYDTTQFGGILP